jgi:diaminopimelate epimerase
VIPSGRPFFKMSGSGNDFVVVDARAEAPGPLADPSVIRSICARGTGVGADGIVFLETDPSAAVRLTYINADGSRAELCGNATLCTTRLAVELGAAPAAGFDIATDSGPVSARLVEGLPEIDLQPVTKVVRDHSQIDRAAGEDRIGFAEVGVPHLVILCRNVEAVDVVGRGRPLRRHSTLPRGANVNFVAPLENGTWRMRTYERGVEAETLACGSGAVATAILLTCWDLESADPVELVTSSGRQLRVRLRRQGEAWLPSLAGEGRVVYQGRLAEVLP